MYTPSTYGDSLAEVYDYLYPAGPDTDQAVEFIHKLASGGSVLELGVGTGRLALPLAAKGLTVHGVDASSEMLAKLKALDAEGRVTTTQGDFSEDLPEGTFDVTLIPLNTLFMIPDPEKQIDTLRLMRSRTAPGGVVVVETYDPRIYHGKTEPRTDAHHLDNGQVAIHTTQVLSLPQTVVIMQTFLGGETPRRVVEVSRYAWLPELDLMARVAGLKPRARYSNWTEDPVGDESRRYVSVFEAVADDE